MLRENRSVLARISAGHLLELTTLLLCHSGSPAVIEELFGNFMIWRMKMTKLVRTGLREQNQSIYY